MSRPALDRPGSSLSNPGRQPARTPRAWWL